MLVKNKIKRIPSNFENPGDWEETLIIGRLQKGSGGLHYMLQGYNEPLRTVYFY